MKKLVIILAGLLAAAVLVVGGIFTYYTIQLRPVSTSAMDTTTFIIEQGETTQQVAARLEQSKLIKSDTALNWYMRLTSQKGFNAGTYEISAKQSVQSIVSLLQEGREVRTSFTIIPGKRLDQIKTTFLEAGFTESDVELALSPQTHSSHLINNYKPADASFEGYLFPETFIISENTTATQIVDLSLDEMYKALNSRVRAGFSAQGLTVHQGVILASIVEKEVNSEEDKPIVSQVFLKRLREGITLGSDVTFFYADAVFGGGAFPDNDSPYNTRLYAGLPPGPISNMSLSTLIATAEPSDTDYLYFVAGDNGTTYFNNTLQEHNNDAQMYCIELCKL